MARTRTRSAPTPEHNSLIASAIRMPPVTRNTTGKTQAWQGEAWGFYDRVAELRFVANWVGNVMSRAKLVAAKRVGDTLVVETDGPGAEALDALYGGMLGQQQMLQAAGVHLTVSGEYYSVMLKDDWHTLAYDRVSGSSGSLTCDLGDGARTPIKGKQDMAIRVWTPHPREPLRADSPTQSNRGTLAEIATLSDHIAAQLESRLAGAGILWVPSEITFPTPKEADPSASVADQFMAVLGEAMMTPIKDRASASAIVPIVVTAPGEYLKEARHMTFWSELDAETINMRDNAVKRLAIGLDTPPEILLGMGDTNHWSAWLVDEAAIKSHMEPRLQVICHAYTEGYLRPALTGTAGAEDYYVLADTSDIRLRPNRSKEAFEMYDRGELSGTALRRETGFQTVDEPDGDEERKWLLRRIATGSTSPEQTQAALRLLGADLGIVDETGGQKSIPPVLQPQRSLKGHPENKVPDMDRSNKDRESREGVVAACDVLVYRALERTGNRLCNGAMKAQLADIPAHWRYMYVDEVPDNALEGAWGFVDEVLSETGNMPDTVRICAALDGYVRFILSDRRKHHRDLLEAALIASGVVEP
jgi:hypothetical protein